MHAFRSAERLFIIVAHHTVFGLGLPHQTKIQMIHAMHCFFLMILINFFYIKVNSFFNYRFFVCMWSTLRTVHISTFDVFLVFFITKGHFIHNKCSLLHNLTYVCPFMHEDNTVHKWQGKSLKLNRFIISSSLLAQQNMDLSANVIPVIQFKHRRETMSIYHNWDPPLKKNWQGNHAR